MNSLTKKEKIELLEKVRNSLLEYLKICYYELGICHIIQMHTEPSAKAIENNIPELLKYKPIDASKYWFSMDKAGHGKRIEIINQTISDLENPFQEKEIEEVYFKCKPENILLNETTNKTYYYYGSDFSLRFPMDFIKENPDLFIVKTKDDLLNDSMNDKLYKLQEYCKEKIPAEKNKWVKYMFTYRFVKKDKIEIFYSSINLSDFSFDSEEQAIMFLYKINLPENEELRNYFINTLKN